MLMVAVFMMMTVAGASFGRAGQCATHIGDDEVLDRGLWRTGPHCDALLRKELKRAPTNAARDYRVDTQPKQPAREDSRRVRRSLEGAGGQDGPVFGVGLHERKVGAAAEMAVKPSVNDGNCDGHIRISTLAVMQVSCHVRLGRTGCEFASKTHIIRRAWPRPAAC